MADKVKLTEVDTTNLGWMVRCNDDHGIGFLGPSVRRFGRMPECENLIRNGHATCNDHGSRRESGYWITPAGRALLSSSGKDD
jgi:hypothetical protein